MSLFLSLHTVRSFEEAFRAKDCASMPMQDAIRSWFELYYNRESTQDENHCQQIPYTIVNKLTRAMFSEYRTETKDVFAEGVLSSLERVKQTAMQYLMIGGECFLKPIPSPSGWRWAVISRANAFVFARDADGKPTDIGLVEQTSQGGYYYTLLERRTLTDGSLTIQNTLYRSSDRSTIGTRCSLSSLSQYAELPDSYTYQQPFSSVGLVRIKTPMVNCVDGSEDGVSVYAAAAGLIHDINRNEAQLAGEFERGQSRIIVSRDMLSPGRDGRRRLRDNIFVGVDDEPKNTGITIFSPQLREQSFLARKQEYLRSCENIIGLKRGILSEVEATERTAKEITSTEGEYNLTVIDLQGVWTTAVQDALALCAVIGQLYKVQHAHLVADDAVSIDYGDGVLYNRDKVATEMMAMVQAGMLQPERYLGWYYNLPCDTEEERASIRAAYMPGDTVGGE